MVNNNHCFLFELLELFLCFNLLCNVTSTVVPDQIYPQVQAPRIRFLFFFKTADWVYRPWRCGIFYL